jgi:hypothetical protein
MKEASPEINFRMLEPHEILNHDDCTDAVFEGGQNPAHTCNISKVGSVFPYCFRKLKKWDNRLYRLGLDPRPD